MENSENIKKSVEKQRKETYEKVEEKCEKSRGNVWKSINKY